MLSRFRNYLRAKLYQSRSQAASNSVSRRINAIEYAARAAKEIGIFADQTEVHDLPDIFHYWSNKYLRPQLEQFGFSNPDDFFVQYLKRSCADAASIPVRIASLGSGNGDTEVRIAKKLIDQGVHDFTIDCVDHNPDMLERAKSLARGAGLESHISPILGDFNTWQPAHRYHAIMANQSLHHVVELETLFDAIKSSLHPDGRFITSDMIGRNGHMRWPEALEIVQEYWRELPEEYRWNVQLRRHEKRFENWDCSVASFEGIRAQDILPLLTQKFDFELFIGYGNIIDPFIDRSFGPHFDAESDQDRQFIDRVHARDEKEIRAGNITPTHIMAVLRNKPYTGKSQYVDHLTPEFCLRDPDASDLDQTQQT